MALALLFPETVGFSHGLSEVPGAQGLGCPCSPETHQVLRSLCEKPPASHLPNTARPFTFPLSHESQDASTAYSLRATGSNLRASLMIKGRERHLLSQTETHKGRFSLDSHPCHWSPGVETSSSLTVSSDQSRVFTDLQIRLCPFLRLGSQGRPLCAGWDFLLHLRF